MTIQECHDLFDLLLDKEADPYFTRDNKDLYINMAQLEYVKRLLVPSNEGDGINIEETELDFNNVSTLVYEVQSPVMGSTGKVTVASVQSALDTLSGTTDPLMYVLNVSGTFSAVTLPVLYTRHNDWYEFERNSFKRGSASQPRYKTDSVNFTFSPIDTSASLSFTLLKTPRSVDFQNGTDCELPAHTHKQIVELAVELASVSVREGDLTQLNHIQSNA